MESLQLNKFKIIAAFGLLLVILFALTTVQTSAQIPSPLGVTVATDKASYKYREKVSVKGNLTYSGSPTDGLVGIEINSLNASYSNFTHFVTRTATIGNPYVTGNITIVYLGTTDTSQPPHPKTTFNKGDQVGVNVTIVNNSFNERNIILTVLACDNDSTPMTTRVLNTQVQIPGYGGRAVFTPQFKIESWVSPGKAKLYANAYEDWPSLGGRPWCREKNATFTINRMSGSAPMGSTQLPSSSNYAPLGSAYAYLLSFRMPPYAPRGNYNVSVSGFHQGFLEYNHTAFNRAPQVLGDIDFSHQIGVTDLVRITGIYGKQGGDAGWNPEADVFASGKIDILDVVVVTGKYGYTY